MDFVITWVDDSDPEWKAQFNNYRKQTINDNRDVRFRSWDNFHFWFRGVEKFAPWVDKVHFVTWGHIPKWLNINHPKLNIVKHTDFIPKEYLPTFNTRTIELNLHRIEGLCDEYVLFNDDVFLIDKVDESTFFVKGKPCDMPILKPFDISVYSKTILNDLIVINKHFDKRMAFKKQPCNWINLSYGKFIISNLFFNFFFRSHHLSFKNFHLALPSKKETLMILWELEFEVMHNSSKKNFRDYDTVNNYVQRYWDLASNNFHPTNITKIGSHFDLDDDNVKDVAKFIKSQKKPIVCVNDGDNLEKFEVTKNEIINAFGKLFSEKSNFEL